MNNNTPQSHEQLQKQLNNQERLITAVEELTSALNTLNSNLTCEFTGWNLTEALSSIAHEINQKNSN